MIFTKTLIPEVYSQSYDMSVFTGLLDLIYNASDLNTLALKALHTPSYCFRHNLHHLSSCFNLPTQSREVLLKYRHLIKMKGTSYAIEAAILLAGATEISKIIFSTFGMVTYYIKYEQLDEDLLHSMLMRLVPVDVEVFVLPAETDPTSTAATKTTTN